MNKEILVKTVAGNIDGATKKDIEVVVNEVFDTIKNTLASGEKVAIAGFGSFEVAERAERQGRNPKTGETITIHASKSPKFKAGKALKDIVNA